MNPTVRALTLELQELEANRPEMPRGLDPEHPLFVTWHHAFQKHVSRKHLLIAQINGAMHPIETRVIQERPMAALKPLPSRLRQ